MDTVCPTLAELPDDLRHDLPLPQWAALHRTLRAGPDNASHAYSSILADLETEGLLRQALLSDLPTESRPVDQLEQQLTCTSSPLS